MRTTEQVEKRQAEMRLRHFVKAKGWDKLQVHVQFDRVTEEIKKRETITPREANRRNQMWGTTRGANLWILESAIPYSEEDPAEVDALLRHIEKTIVHEPKSLTPSQLGGERFLRSCNYHLPNSSVRNVIPDQHFSDMEEV